MLRVSSSEFVWCLVVVVAGWWVGMVEYSGGRRNWGRGGMVVFVNRIVGLFGVPLVVPSKVHHGGRWFLLILGGCWVCRGPQFDLLIGPVAHCKIGSGVPNRPK